MTNELLPSPRPPQTKVKPLISVVIPAYQAEPYIEATIRSVLQQTFPDFELIIVDDGCTDNTVEIIKRFTDPRIQLVQQNNLGLSSARNTGIKTSRGKYIAFLDADDLWFPRKLAVDLETLNRCPSDVCMIYSGHYCVDDDYDLVNIPKYPRQGVNTFETLLRGGTIIPSSLLIHRDILDAVEGFPVHSKRFLEDRVFYARVCHEFPAYPTGARMVLYRQCMSGLALGPLKSYDLAVSVEHTTIELLRQELPEHEYNVLNQFHTRSLLNRFLKFNAMSFARRYASQVPVALLVGDPKGWLTIFSLATGLNLLYASQLLLRNCLKYLSRPWWYPYRATLMPGIRTTTGRQNKTPLKELILGRPV